MKTFKLLLVTALWITLCTGLYSCGKDDIEPTVMEPITPDEFFPIERIFKEYITNSSNITCKYYQEKKDSMLLSGIKDKHLWFAYFNKTTKKQISEWIDIEETDTIYQIYKGYGEYEQIIVRGAFPLYYKETNTGNIVGFVFNSLPKSKTIFTYNKKSRRTPIGDMNLPYNWYKESLFIDNCCYSYEGDTIYVAKEKPRFENGKIDTDLISHEEGIKLISNSISKYSYKEAKTMWSTSIIPPFDITSDAKRSYTLLDNATNIWEYKCEAIFYDGTKKDFTFKINIEDGRIIADVTGVTLNEIEKELDINDTFQLVATVQPNNATNKNVTWKSSNESIAKVNDKGLVTAMSEGTTTITATTEDGHFTAQTVVKVLSSKRIVSIKSEDYNISFVYSNDKLNSFIWKYTNGDYDFNQTIAYSDVKVIISGEADGNKCIQTYLLNKYGHATSCSISDYNGKSIDISFEYSEKGYLTKAIEITKYNSETRSNTYSFTYSDNGDVLNGKESHTSGNIYTQSYGSVRNKSGIMDYAMSQLLFNYQAAFYCGILGKSCTHLPSSCKKTEVYEMGWSRTYDFIYTQDDSGYVTKTIIADSEGKAETLNYTYE